MRKKARARKETGAHACMHACLGRWGFRVVMRSGEKISVKRRIPSRFK